MKMRIELPNLLLIAVTVALVTLAPAAAALIVVENPPSTYLHTVDGQFTDWTPDLAPGTPYEWFDIEPVAEIHVALGLLGFIYDDYQPDGWLYKLNDWTISTGPANVVDDNIFIIKTLDGLDTWQFTVKSDPGAKSVECLHNGVPCPVGEFHGDYGVVSTPNKLEPHSVWEISLLFGPPRPFVEERFDPPCAGCALVRAGPEFVEPVPGGGTRVTVVPAPGTLPLVIAAFAALGIFRANRQCRPLLN